MQRTRTILVALEATLTLGSHALDCATLVQQPFEPQGSWHVLQD